MRQAGSQAWCSTDAAVVESQAKRRASTDIVRFLRIGLTSSSFVHLSTIYMIGVGEKDGIGWQIALIEGFLSSLGRACVIHVLVVMVTVGGCLSSRLGLPWPHPYFRKEAENVIDGMGNRRLSQTENK